MCASSSAKIRNEEVGIYMGHYGGSLKIGDTKYAQDDDDSRRKAMKIKLESYTKEELSKLMLSLIDNALE